MIGPARESSGNVGDDQCWMVWVASSPERILSHKHSKGSV